jgi:alpha-glucosidase (family GH31 glycosyl hydrolase)
MMVELDDLISVCCGEAAANGALVRECGEAAYSPIDLNSWWGSGGMVDWTNPDAAAWWRDHRRQTLIDAGVIGHWTDLGEPEDFDESAWYYGFPDLGRHDHASIHNVYNLLWSKSIWDGYQRGGIERRPFILSRSGTSSIQRSGAALCRAILPPIWRASPRR